MIKFDFKKAKKPKNINALRDVRSGMYRYTDKESNDMRVPCLWFSKSQGYYGGQELFDHSCYRFDLRISS
jgi:hypothetical protein